MRPRNAKGLRFGRDCPSFGQRHSHPSGVTGKKPPRPAPVLFHRGNRGTGADPRKPQLSCGFPLPRSPQGACPGHTPPGQDTDTVWHLCPAAPVPKITGAATPGQLKPSFYLWF